MPTEALLDFSALLEPIAGDNPAGEPVSFMDREKLEEARKEDDPDDYEPDDPMRPQVIKKADWKGIVRDGKELLAKKSKDLLVAARITEALVKTEGYAGLRDGLQLLRQLMTDCWDRLHPDIDDGDLEVRASPFNWLDDPDRGARFPTTVRMVPIVVGEEGAYTYMDWKRSQDSSGGVTQDQFQMALQATPFEQIKTTAEDIGQCREELTKLVQVLDEKLGKDAPALTSVRQAVEECNTLIKQIVSLKAPEEAGEEEGDGATGGGGGGGGSPRPATTRAEAYRQLTQVANTLQHIEPHSPIPYLIKRAVELGSMPFPQLIKELVRDTTSLGDVQRFVGLKDEEGT